MAKKISTKDLVARIEKLAKARIASQPVVSLDVFREAKKKLEPKTLLVIEDDESMRSAYQRIFSQEGYQLKMAEDATALTQVLDDEPIDIIILDIALPWINGFELAAMLKEHKDLKHLPLVFVSGSQNEDDIKQAFAVGASDYIKKPFDVEKLKKSIRTLLKLQES